MEITKEEAELIIDIFFYMVINNQLNNEEIILLEKLKKFVEDL